MIMDRSVPLLGSWRRLAIGAAVIAVSACSPSPDVEVVAQNPITTTSTTSTTSTTPGQVSPPPIPAPTLPSTTRTTVPAPAVDVDDLAGLISAEPSGRHVALVIDGVQPIEDDTAWQATWQTLNGRLLADHLDEQPAGMPPGAMIAGAPTLRTEFRYRADGLGSQFGPNIDDQYEMMIEMPGVTDAVVAAEYITAAVAEAVTAVTEVTGITELPNRRAGVWPDDAGSFIELSGPEASYEISVVESVLPSDDAEPRPVLRLTISRQIPAGNLDGFDAEGSLFTPVEDRFDRLDIASLRTGSSLSSLSRVVAGSSYRRDEPVIAFAGATVFHPGVTVDGMDQVLEDVALVLTGDFERDDQYIANGQTWFVPVDRARSGSYIFEHTGAGLEVTVVGRRIGVDVVESDPPSQQSVIDDADTTTGSENDVIEFAFDGLNVMNPAELGPAVTTLSGGRSARVLLAEEYDIDSMDPPILVADAPITNVRSVLHGPVFDPDTSAVTSAEAYEVSYTQAVQVDGDVRQTQLDIQAAIVELVEERFPGESLVQDSYEVVDGRFDDGVSIGGGFPQRLTISIGPLDPSEDAAPNELSFFVRRFMESPDPSLVRVRSDWIGDGLTKLITIVEPVGQIEPNGVFVLDSVAINRFGSRDGQTALISSSAELDVPTPGGSAELFSSLGELIAAAGYDEDRRDAETSSFTRPEPERSDRFLVLGSPDEIAVIINTDSVAI